jgi:type I restriction enzyme, S subunit
MNMKKGYKLTDIGIIPQEWEVKNLGEIAFLKRGKFTPRPRNDPRYYGGNIPFVQTGDVTNSNGKILSYTQTLNGEGLGVSTLFKKGTILMTIAANIGYSGILQIDMACPDSLVAIDGILAENDFLNHYFIFKRQDIEDLSTSGTQKNLSIELLKPFQITYPPSVSEQKAIAQALSDTDALITALDALIDKKRLMKQGTMQQLLTGKRRLEGFGGEWVEITFEEAFDFIPTASFSRDELSENQETRYVHYGDIHTKFDYFLDFSTTTLPTIESDKAKRYSLLQEGDLIMADASEDYSGIGKSIEVKSIKNIKAIAGLHTFHLRDKKGLFANGFKGYLQANKEIKKQIDRLATGLKVFGISKNNLKLVSIFYPPSVTEQKAIAEILSDMDNEIAALEAKRHKYKQVKQGMMQELLTGKTRLQYE